jgi:hypothetical protein
MLVIAYLLLKMTEPLMNLSTAFPFVYSWFFDVSVSLPALASYHPPPGSRIPDTADTGKHCLGAWVSRLSEEFASFHWNYQ